MAQISLNNEFIELKNRAVEYSTLICNVDKPVDVREGGNRGGKWKPVYESVQCVQEVNKGV